MLDCGESGQSLDWKVERYVGAGDSCSSIEVKSMDAVRVWKAIFTLLYWGSNRRLKLQSTEGQPRVYQKQKGEEAKIEQGNKSIVLPRWAYIIKDACCGPPCHGSGQSNAGVSPRKDNGFVSVDWSWPIVCTESSNDCVNAVCCVFERRASAGIGWRAGACEYAGPCGAGSCMAGHETLTTGDDKTHRTRE